ncbi:MAG: Rieske (2Fe-2S) protein [Methanolobus sp.]|jgi:3-phenylpropionate/trans-cinnamate dioxygenase ferredoxin subunit|nr:Rieske (2Fe-2S) protein [Methanolobus sp.]
MTKWVIVANDDEVKEGEMKALDVGGKQVLLIRKAGEMFALENRCPHMNCRLDGGTLQDYSLKCPCHSWIFDIRSGAYVASDKIKVNVYDTQVKDGEIAILI